MFPRQYLLVHRITQLFHNKTNIEAVNNNVYRWSYSKQFAGNAQVCVLILCLPLSRNLKWLLTLGRLIN
jgi:hypothetical protein